MLIFSGCEFALEHQTACVVFSSRPMTKNNLNLKNFDESFPANYPIYFGVYSKEPFNTNEGRIQILKKDPKSTAFGYSLEHGRDIELNPAQNYTTGAFTLYSEGFYLMRIFSKNNPNIPIAQNTFWVY